MDTSDDEEYQFSSGMQEDKSKESLSSDYLKISGTEEDGDNSSPEVISGPEEDEIPPPPVSHPPELPPPFDSQQEEKEMEDEIEEITTTETSTSMNTNIEDVPVVTRPSPKPRSQRAQQLAQGYLSCLNNFNPVVLNIIYWKDIKLTAVTYVISMVVLITLYLNTLLHTVVLMILASMIVSLLFIITKIAIDSFYNKQIVNPFRTYMASDIQVLNEEVALSLARSAIIGFNYNVNALARLIFFSSWLNSLKFMGFLFLFSYITNYLSIIINMFLVINLLFFVPPFYSRHRYFIDDIVSKVGNELNLVYTKIQGKLPFLPKLKDD